MKDMMSYVIKVPDILDVRVRHFNLKPVPFCVVSGTTFIPVTPIADAIGHSRAVRLLAYVDDDHKRLMLRYCFQAYFPSKRQSLPYTWVVDEAGLEQIVARSRMPMADKFLVWAHDNIFHTIDDTTATAQDHEEELMTEDAEPTEEPTEGQATAVPLVETEIIPFTGSGLQVVKPGSGCEAIILKRACEDMGLAYPAQFVKLKAAHWACVSTIETQVGGQRRRLSCLDIASFPMWLATIDPGRCNEESRPTIRAFQKDAARVLYDYYRGAPRNQASGQSFDMAVFAQMLSMAFGHGTQHVIVPAIKEAIEPLKTQLDQIELVTQEQVQEALEPLQAQLDRIELATQEQVLTISLDEICKGPLMTLHDWADSHGYVATSKQLKDWGFHMRSWWVKNRLVLEKRRYKSGIEVCLYPEGAINYAFNFTCDSDVLKTRKAKTATQQEFPFRNGSPVR